MGRTSLCSVAIWPGTTRSRRGSLRHCYYLAQKGVAEDYCDQFDVDGDSYLREYEIGIDENAYCVCHCFRC